MVIPNLPQRETTASVTTFPIVHDDDTFNAFSCQAERLPGGEAMQPPYMQPFASSLTSRLSGKRSRTNSPDSYSDSPPSDGASSIWSLTSSQSSNRSASNPPSPFSSQESDVERGCPSPTTTKRKALRCHRKETACAASLRRQLGSLNVDSGSAPPPSLSLSAASSSVQSDAAPSQLVPLCCLGSRKTRLEESSAAPLGFQPCADGGNTGSGSGNVTDADIETTDLMKGVMVDHLVGVSIQTIHVLWYQPLALTDEKHCSMDGLSLHLFVRETLRRSRTSCSTLQAALLYCLRCGPAIQKRQAMVMQDAHERNLLPAEYLSRNEGSASSPLLCGRRIFLASIMVAAKYLQDKTFSNRAWSKITGLPVKQLANVEREFLAGIQWDLNVKDEEWNAWTARLANVKAAKLQAMGSSTAKSLPLPLAASKALAFESSSRSSTPTPTNMTMKMGRSILARSNSNDVSATKLYDAIIAGSPPLSTPPLSRSVHLASEAGEGEAIAISSPSSCEANDTPTAAPTVPKETCKAASPLLAASRGPPAPFPMHRSFVRSSASFSAHPASSSPSLSTSVPVHAKAVALAL